MSTSSHRAVHLAARAGLEHEEFERQGRRGMGAGTAHRGDGPGNLHIRERPVVLRPDVVPG